MRHLTHRARLLVVVLLAAIGLAVAGSPAWAGGPPPHNVGHPAGRYLALGDSVPFGFIGGQPDAFYDNIAHFTGYPEILARQEHLDLLNASCPGETTASFIDVNRQSNGCVNRMDAQGNTVPGGYRDLHPLHVQYASRAQSQLQYAIAALQAHPDTSLVTIQLGANDAFLCQKDPANGCDTPAEVVALAQTVGQNLGLILQTLRTEGGYTGQIVVVNYWAMDYSDVAGVAATQALNTALAAAAAAAGADVADAFGAYQPIAEAKGGGDVIKAGLVRENDVHPTHFGQLVLARAVEEVAAV